MVMRPQTRGKRLNGTWRLMELGADERSPYEDHHVAVVFREDQGQLLADRISRRVPCARWHRVEFNGHELRIQMSVHQAIAHRSELVLRRKTSRFFEGYWQQPDGQHKQWPLMKLVRIRPWRVYGPRPGPRVSRPEGGRPCGVRRIA